MQTRSIPPSSIPPEILPRRRWFANGIVKIQSGVDPDGHGLFATRNFSKGETVGRFGGRLVSANNIDDVVSRLGTYGHQVHENWYVCPSSRDEIRQVGAINHSCDPNVGMSDSLTLVAIRDIKANETHPVELLIDYAFTGSPAGGFDGCNCQSTACRGGVTREDWKIVHLQKNYFSCFPPFKQRMIAPGQEEACSLHSLLEQIEPA